MAQTFAMIMAGGPSANLSILTEVRAEPAVPFGGKFRLIDFPLSNCVNSGIFNVAVLTQYRPRSLNGHIGIGKPWDLDRASGGVRLLQPYQGGPHGDWQKGNADAVRRNLDFVDQQDADHVLILAGNHIYTMDYRPLIQQHMLSEAELTVAVRRVNPFESHRYGIVSVGTDRRITEFREKPKYARGTLASMGVYIFREDVLRTVLAKNKGVDFGRDILPAMLAAGQNVQAYTYPGYWANVGTVQAYREANMSLLAEDPALDLYNPEWVVHTRSEERAPAKIGEKAETGSSLFANGCRVDGTVERSVLSSGVYVAEGAVVRDSIILNDTLIETGAVVERAIVDKDVTIGAGAKIGDGDDNTPNQEAPERINTGLTLIGKASCVPGNVVVGRNVVVHAFSDKRSFGKRKNIASGTTIGKTDR